MTTKTKNPLRGRYVDRAQIAKAVTYFRSLKNPPYGTQKAVALKFGISTSSLSSALKKKT